MWEKWEKCYFTRHGKASLFLSVCDHIETSQIVLTTLKHNILSKTILEESGLVCKPHLKYICNISDTELPIFNYSCFGSRQEKLLPSLNGVWVVKKKVRKAAGRVWNRRGQGLPLLLSHHTGRNSRGGSSFTLITLPGLPIAFPHSQWVSVSHRNMACTSCCGT